MAHFGWSKDRRSECTALLADVDVFQTLQDDVVEIATLGGIRVIEAEIVDLC